jgi:hypothetical protein
MVYLYLKFFWCIFISIFVFFISFFYKQFLVNLDFFDKISVGHFFSFSFYQDEIYIIYMTNFYQLLDKLTQTIHVCFHSMVKLF